MIVFLFYRSFSSFDIQYVLVALLGCLVVLLNRLDFIIFLKFCEKRGKVVGQQCEVYIEPLSIDFYGHWYKVMGDGFSSIYTFLEYSSLFSTHHNIYLQRFHL